MSNNNLFPDNMIFDGDLTGEQYRLLESQYRKFLNLRGEVFGYKQYQLYLDENKKPYFPRGTLIHGTSCSMETLKNISETGILACEFLGMHEDFETFYCADFHRVPNNMLVSSYDSMFKPDGKTPFNRVNSRIAFVVNPTSKLGGLLYYDLFDAKFDSVPEVRNIINVDAIPRGFLDENRGTGAAILGGIPANAISGIVIGDKLVLRDSFIEEIEKLFPNAYIITRKGMIIKDRSNIININDHESLALETARLDIKHDILSKEYRSLEVSYERNKEDFARYMDAVMRVASPFIQAKILLEFGYQSIPVSLLELLSSDELKELGINNKSVKK